MSLKFNAALIDLINENVPEHTNPCAFIADTLNIGREAAYRRLRGEVLFTFDEAALLGSQLHISLDRAMGLVGAGNVLFQLQFTDFYSTLETYNDILKKEIHFFHQIASEANTVFATAGSAIPAEFYMRHEYMAKFKFFKWLYQHGLSDPSVRTFEQMQVPEALIHRYGEYVKSVQGVKTTCYVLDDESFSHWVNAIRAFRAMHLISDESVRILKGELLQLLDEVEQIAINGQYDNGNTVFFYLSNFDLESTYSYVSAPNCKTSIIGVFSLNSLRTPDPAIFDQVKRWIRTQTRFSTLISGCGELQRLLFFKRQRAILAKLEREDIMPSLETIQN